MRNLNSFIELNPSKQEIINYFDNSTREEIIKFCDDNYIFCKKYFFTNKMRKNVTQYVIKTLNK